MKQITREQLYELVWSKPMRDAAATIPMSDVGLQKMCRRNGVPVPSQGYWNKLRAGHRMPPRPPLPPPPAPQVREPLAVKPERVSSKMDVDVPLPKSKSMPTRKQSAGAQRSRPRRGGRWPTEIHYIMPIERWEWGYSFGVNNTRRLLQGIFLDHRHLIVYGKLIRPSLLKEENVKLSFVPSNVRDEAKHYTEAPPHIGSIWKDREARCINSAISMPEDVLPSLLPMLQTERLRYVVFAGTPLFRGQADIRSYRFAVGVDLDDFPPETST